MIIDYVKVITVQPIPTYKNTVRVSDSEKEWLQSMADFHGITLSDLMKQYSINELEDEYDLQTAKVAHKLWLDDDQKVVSMHEILAELGGHDERWPLPTKIY